MLQGQLSFFQAEPSYVTKEIKLQEINIAMALKKKILQELDYKIKIILDDFKDQKINDMNIQDC